MENIQKLAFKPGLEQEFEIVDLWEIYQKNRDLMIQPHRVAFYHILCFTDAHTEHEIDFQPITTHPGMILFLHADHVQRFDANAEVRGKSVCFTDSFFAQSENDHHWIMTTPLFHDFQGLCVLQVNERDHILYRCLAMMEEELKWPKDKNREIILKHLLHNFLLHAEREQQQSIQSVYRYGPEGEDVAAFRKLVNQFFKERKLISEYASMIGISEKRLSQSTAKMLGATPKEMVDQRIILECKRMLAYTSQSVKEIGYALGFDEPTNFVKFFKKHTSKTPLEFRENLMELDGQGRI